MLATELVRVVAEVPLEGKGPAALGDYAGRLFDRHSLDGILPRLQFWEGLERGDYVVNREARASHCAAKIDTMLHVLPGIDRADAADLLLTVVTLCGGWTVLPQLDALMAGSVPGRLARRRDFVVRTVTLLAESLLADAA